MRFWAGVNRVVHKIVAAGGGCLIAASTAQAAEVVRPEIPPSRSLVEIGFLNEDKDYKHANTYSLHGLAVTPYGGFSFLYRETIGEQRLQPWEQNVVTNGSKPRDFFKREKGRIRAGGIGYGFNHHLAGDTDYSFRLSYGEGRGYSYAASNVTGHMDQSSYHAGLSAGARNILTDLGAAVDLAYGFEKNFSRFDNGTSDEVVITRRSGLRFSLPLIPGRLTLVPALSLEHERSDVVNGDPAPGAILIDRVVAHQREELGIGVKWYRDYRASDYLLASFTLLTGEQRHEFQAADLDGFRIRVERGTGNTGGDFFLEPAMVFHLDFEQRLSTSFTEWPETDPATGLPIILEFAENRRYNRFTMGVRREKDFSIQASYEEPVKSGSTVARSDLLHLRLPMASADLEYKELELKGTKKWERLRASLTFAHEFKYSNTELGIAIGWDI